MALINQTDLRCFNMHTYVGLLQRHSVVGVVLVDTTKHVRTLAFQSYGSLRASMTIPSFNVIASVGSWWRVRCNRSGSAPFIPS